MRNPMRWLAVAALGLVLVAQAQTPGDKAWLKLEKAIARGDHSAAAQAVAGYGEQALPLLLAALQSREDAVREAAAGELRELARRDTDSVALRAAMPALRAALQDRDGEVVATLASTLALLGDTDAALADVRRAVLRSGESRPHVRFNAARSLIGIDPDPALLPDLLAFLFDSVPGNNRGNWDVEVGIVENHDLAMEALTRLAARNDRRLIPPLVVELDTAHPVVPSIMRVLAAFDPDPEAWPEVLLRLTRSPGDNIREVAWELLGEAQTKEQLAVWWPAGLAALDDADARGAALGAILDVRGVRADGLERVAACCWIAASMPGSARPQPKSCMTPRTTISAAATPPPGPPRVASPRRPIATCLPANPRVSCSRTWTTSCPTSGSKTSAWPSWRWPQPNAIPTSPRESCCWRRWPGPVIGPGHCSRRYRPSPHRPTQR
jgi:tetratricopeptide (TPR) repeat protein